MPTLLARYLAGEHEAVWAEPGTGPLPVARAEAEAIARATLRRVRADIELLVGRPLGAAEGRYSASRRSRRWRRSAISSARRASSRAYSSSRRASSGLTSPSRNCRRPSGA